MSAAWTKQVFTFDWLERYAHQFGHLTSIFEWLKVIGAVPNDVEKMNTTQVRVSLDPQHIEAGYLASTAYEWDSWGRSTPLQFMEALSYELAGAPEDKLGRMLREYSRPTA